MKSQKRSAGVETVYNYIAYILSAFLAFRSSRYDLKGSKLLEVNEKYYFGDLGLKNKLR
jgi:hypothetical protein